jgi:hypothetical protein
LDVEVMERDGIAVGKDVRGFDTEFPPDGINEHFDYLLHIRLVFVAGALNPICFILFPMASIL